MTNYPPRGGPWTDHVTVIPAQWTTDVDADITDLHTNKVDSSDSRLSDSRTPTAHAASHAAAGTDPITINETQVTGLTADLASKISTSRQVATGTGLTGGGDLSADRTIALANTAVTPGVYTNLNATVDAQGRITAAANGTGGGSGITALTGDVTASGTGSVAATLASTAVTPGSYTSANITVDAKGRVTAAANGGGAGVATVFGRSGTVVATAGDYSADKITSNPATTGLSATQVEAALTELNNDRASDQAATITAARSGMALSTRQIATGTGLSGGGDLSADRTLALANTAVTAGSYTSANITVDAQGRLTAASNGAGGGSGEAALAPTAVKTANYTAAVADFVPVDATSGAITITLPTAPADKSRIAIKKIDASANAVTINRGGSDVFNKAGGSTSLSLTLQFQTLMLQYNSSGAIWYVIAADRPVSDLLTKANNLSDVASASTARTNLGLVAVASSGSAADLSTGTLPAGRMPALTGDVTTSAGAVATTLANTAVTPGSYTSANITVDSKGRLTAASNGSGGSGVDSWSSFMSLAATPVAHTGTAWAPTQASATYFSGVNVNGGGAVNDSGTWVTTLSAGTWQLDLFGRSQSAAGIATVEFSTNGGTSWTSIGTWDLYAASNTSATNTFTGITVGTSGRVLLRFTALTKNASSSSYQMPLGAAQWQRTA